MCPSAFTIAQVTMTSPVRVYSEFDPLEEVIVGRVYAPEAFDAVDDPPLRDMLQRVARETEEDFSVLATMLEADGITVRRPTISQELFEWRDGVPVPRAVDSGAWAVPYPNPPVFPRDLTLTLGSRMYSVYARAPNRWLEGLAFYDLFLEYYQQGAEWISMPLPLLDMAADSYVAYERKALLFHAAALQRCGRDIFHTTPAAELPLSKGTELGLRWLKENVGSEYRFHQLQRHGHIDSKFALLKPGLVMTWLPRHELPECLQKWDIIKLDSKAPLPAEFVAMREQRFYRDFVDRWLHEWIGYVDETYFDVNVLSLGPDRVMLNGYNKELFAKIQQHGIEPIPFDFRHRIFWDGGLHCITLDVRRRGECEDYFSG